MASRMGMKVLPYIGGQRSERWYYTMGRGHGPPQAHFCENFLRELKQARVVEELRREMVLGKARASLTAQVGMQRSLQLPTALASWRYVTREPRQACVVEELRRGMVLGQAKVSLTAQVGMQESLLLPTVPVSWRDATRELRRVRVVEELHREMVLGKARPRSCPGWACGRLCWCPWRWRAGGTRIERRSRSGKWRP